MNKENSVQEIEKLLLSIFSDKYLIPILNFNCINKYIANQVYDEINRKYSKLLLEIINDHFKQSIQVDWRTMICIIARVFAGYLKDENLLSESVDKINNLLKQNEFKSKCSKYIANTLYKKYLHDYKIDIRLVLSSKANLEFGGIWYVLEDILKCDDLNETLVKNINISVNFHELNKKNYTKYKKYFYQDLNLYILSMSLYASPIDFEIDQVGNSVKILISLFRACEIFTYNQNVNSINYDLISIDAGMTDFDQISYVNSISNKTMTVLMNNGINLYRANKLYTIQFFLSFIQYVISEKRNADIEAIVTSLLWYFESLSHETTESKFIYTFLALEALIFVFDKNKMYSKYKEIALKLSKFIPPNIDVNDPDIKFDIPKLSLLYTGRIDFSNQEEIRKLFIDLKNIRNNLVHAWYVYDRHINNEFRRLKQLYKVALIASISYCMKKLSKH